MYHAVVPLFNGYGAARKSCCERCCYRRSQRAVDRCECHCEGHARFRFNYRHERSLLHNHGTLPPVSVHLYWL